MVSKFINGELILFVWLEWSEGQKIRSFSQIKNKRKNLPAHISQYVTNKGTVGVCATSGSVINDTKDISTSMLKKSTQ